MTYLSVQAAQQHEISIEKSRFICSFAPVTTIEEAQQFIDATKKKYWDATHNCSAYVVGDSQQFQKANDDGEPTGTAGIPMLEVLKKRQLTNLVVVVTRYFGGIKLGAGGLVRAYTQSVVSAIEEKAILLEKCPFLKVQFMLPFELAFKVESTLRNDSRFHIENIDYLSSAVTMFVLIQPDDKQVFTQFIASLCNDEIDIYEVAIVYNDKIVVSS